MIHASIPRLFETRLIAAVLAVVPGIALTGCDLWTPALGEQIREFFIDLNDARDEHQPFGTINRTLRAWHGSLQRGVREERHQTKTLLHRLNARSRRQTQPTPVKRGSVPQSQLARPTSAKGAPPLLRLTQPLMRGKRVIRIQQLLRRDGLPIRVDGIYGRETAAAVRGFQRSRGLPADGVVRPATERALGKAANSAKLVRRLKVTRPPLRGPDVIRVQQALRRAGYRLRVDGRFGPQTKRAVTRFQRKHGLSPDGMVGPRTWAVLKTTP